MRIVVEAAGVEPASENVTGQEATCLFQFMPQAFAALRRVPQDVRGCALRTDKKRSPLACNLSLSPQT